jgi:hypothetical protein
MVLDARIALLPICSGCGYARPKPDRIPCPNCGGTNHTARIRIELEERWPGFIKWMALAIKSVKMSLCRIRSEEIPSIDLSRSVKKSLTHRTK